MHVNGKPLTGYADTRLTCCDGYLLLHKKKMN